MGVTAVQLDLHGGETPHDAVIAKRHQYSGAQREILRFIQNYGAITSTQAGVVVHAHREGGCYRCRSGTCRWLSSDGSDAMKRLRDRGLVKRHHRGLWVMA